MLGLYLKSGNPKKDRGGGGQKAHFIAIASHLFTSRERTNPRSTPSCHLDFFLLATTLMEDKRGMGRGGKERVGRGMEVIKEAGNKAPCPLRFYKRQANNKPQKSPWTATQQNRGWTKNGPNKKSVWLERAGNWTRTERDDTIENWSEIKFARRLQDRTDHDSDETLLNLI